MLMPELYPPLIERGTAETNVVIVCEHARNFIPPAFNNLGLSLTAQQSHIAWDPGALGVAQDLRRRLNADLIASSVSRLIYDCNRSPESPSAMPDKSEAFEIPGNRNLTEAERSARATAVYVPFRTALTNILNERGTGIVVTIHSFTPVYHGVRRSCEIGVLHDTDARLAEAMLQAVPANFPFKLERNVPYSATDGVTHTLATVAVPRFWPNVMLEIRNDLIETKSQQLSVAGHLASLLTAALVKMKEKPHA